MIHQNQDTYDDLIDWDASSTYEDTCQVHDEDGTVHYFENGIEVDTFIPGWGC